MPEYSVAHTPGFPFPWVVICDGHEVEAYPSELEAYTVANEATQWWANNPEGE